MGYVLFPFVVCIFRGVTLFVFSGKQVLICFEVAALGWFIFVLWHNFFIIFSASFVGDIVELNLFQWSHWTELGTDLFHQFDVFLEFREESLAVLDLADPLGGQVSEKVDSHEKFLLEIVFMLVWPWLSKSCHTVALVEINPCVFWFGATHC